MRRTLRAALRAVGLELRRIERDEVGVDLRRDIARLGQPGRVVFDVGANEGQSIAAFRTMFPGCHIHAFEPDPAARAKLKSAPDLTINSCGLGEHAERLAFNRYVGSDMSSFLRPGAETWSSVVETLPVEIETLDGYCAKSEIRHIDVLKIDTQGFDLAVLKGGARMIESHKAGLIKIELTFMALYEGQSDPLDILSWLTKRGYALVGFYEQNRRTARLGWCDALLLPA